MTSASRSVASGDLPPLHESASNASTRAQAEYVTCIRISLGLLVIGTLPNAISVEGALLKSFFHWSIALCLLGSVVVFLVVRVRNREKIWYAARALAESTKTMSWRYMMVSDPYGGGNANQVDQNFLSDLHRLVSTEKEVFGTLDAASAGAMQITSAMRQVRASNLNDRLSVYITSRLKDQQAWYAEKAATNQRRSNFFFWGIVILQTVAVASAFVQAANPETSIYPSGLFAAMATSLIAWTQLRKYSELSKAYSLAAHELAGVLSLSGRIANEMQLSDFVGDAENAISREHTLWVARRDS